MALGLVACFVGIAVGPSAAAHKPVAKPTVDYNRDVRPILAQHCWVCHGADKEALKKTGGMKLDSFDGATADRGGYRAITPGNPDKSLLLKRVTDDESPMPPPASGVKPLSKAEVETLRKWISEGAEYRAHWAFVAPTTPPLPAVKNAKWAHNDLDRFILAKLEEDGLAPEPEADKRTLIRRASLALTGLPPTPAEVENFLSDKRPDAYERVVDRLLASPRFGENQARYWLDAVRYADTHGLHIDNERSIFPYRDWVVRAYNEDLPYDQFTAWQIAGDLLPNPTTEQKIATGYVRLNPTTNEGGVIEAEFLAKNTMDRVDTTSTVFLGVTLQCAKCHDHKYDPFTQRDYYSMYAFFDSTADTPLDGNSKLHEPVMKAPTPAENARLQVLRGQLQALVAKTKPDDATQWAATQKERMPTVGKWEMSGPYRAKDFETAYATDSGPESGKDVTWRPSNFSLENPTTPIFNTENASGYLRTTLTVDAPADLDVRLGSDDAIKVWLNGKSVLENKVLRAIAADQDKVTLKLQPGENKLLIKIVNAGGGDGAFVGLGGELTKRLSHVRDLASKPSRTAAENQEIAEIYLEIGPGSDTAKKYRETQGSYKTLEAQVPFTYVAKELPMARPTFVLRRGQYDLLGDPVDRAVPTVFGSIPPNVPKNRLGLAKWIVDPKNPLTARVMVNRIWQQHFGTGLVKTSEDFGTRGDWPTHPELLDYLATRFVKDGWSIKKLTRMILTSAAYRQSAVASEAKRLKDPYNALISRGPRFRLDAEVIRDSALYCGGLLDEVGGGHADKTYQPPGLWEIIAYPISDTAKYMQDHGGALYRRSLYMFWKRTSPPPAMLLFDAPMRESCVVRRSRTNTPTQALASLNETGFVEDARAMAQRVLETKQTDDARIDYAFRLATSRPPTAKELAVIKDFLSQEFARYKAHPVEATKTLYIGESPRNQRISEPEHAAWTLVCNLILNLDETLTQH